MESPEALIETQQQVEQYFSRKGIKKAVLDYMLSIPEAIERIDYGVQLLKEWCETPATYIQKQTRKDHVSQMDLKDLTIEVFVKVASINTYTTLANLASQLAPVIGFSDTRVGILTCAEVIAVLCETSFFDLVKPSVQASIHVQSNFILPPELQQYVERACYLPPMITKPKILKNNRDSGYLTIKGDSLILGGGLNHHSDDICLDVLNLMNSYKLTLNEYILENVKEVPTSDLNHVDDSNRVLNLRDKQRIIQQQHQNWNRHIEQSQYFYKHIMLNNNLMYMTHKYDKRGRIYSQGYHINPQGASYKKAIIDLAQQEVTEVPDGFF